MVTTRRKAHSPRAARVGGVGKAGWEWVGSASPAAFVLLAILLGGASDGSWQSLLVVEILGAVVIAGVLVSMGRLSLPKSMAGPALLLGSALLLIAIHLLPMPYDLWSTLPRRMWFNEGYELLGVQPASMVLSLDPGRTKASALSLIPATAAILLMARAGTRAYLPFATAAAGAAVVSIILGIAQVTGGSQSALRFYRGEGDGTAAAGFFANENHLPTLLLMSIPLVGAAAAQLNSRSSDHPSPYLKPIALLLVFFLGCGVLLVGSVAGILMLPLVLLLSVPVFMPRTAKRSWLKILLVGVAVLTVSAAVILSSANAPGVNTSLGYAALERRGIANKSLEIVSEYWPAGSGIGSFERVYQLHEDPGTVTSVYVNHAHNEYLEILAESGAAGLAMLLMFFFWLTKWTYAAWIKCGPEAHWARSASVCVWIVALHSLVDYPGRTLAILVVAASCIVILRTDASPRRGAGGAGIPDRAPSRSL